MSTIKISFMMIVLFIITVDGFGQKAPTITKVEPANLGEAVALAGGEPLVRQEILDITRDFPEIICLVFTNGLLIDDDLLVKLKGQRNFVPVADTTRQ